MTSLALLDESNLRDQQIRFMDYYFGEANFNGKQAAELAGYAFPKVAASKLKAKLKPYMEARLSQLRAAATMTPQEVMERLTKVGRTEQHKEYVKSLELIGRIHGMLSEKLIVTQDRQTLLKELESLLGMLSKTNSLPESKVIDVTPSPTVDSD